MIKLESNKDYYLVETEKDIAQVFHYLTAGVIYTDTGVSHISNFPPIAIDSETDSLNVRKCKLIGVSMSITPNEAFYFSYKDYTPELKEVFRLHLASFEFNEQIKVLMHNASYDILVLRYTLGVDLLGRLEADTMLMKHTLESTRPHGLKECATKYLGIPNTEQLALKESIIKSGGKFNKTQKDIYLADSMVLAPYAANDADLTLQLFYNLSTKLSEQNLWDLYEDEVHPLLIVTIQHLLSKGVFCDIPYFNPLKQDLESQARELEQQAHNLFKTQYSKHYHSMEQELLEEEYPLKKTGSFIKELLRESGIENITKKNLAKIYEQCPQNVIVQFIANIITEDQLKLEATDLIYHTRKKLHQIKHESPYIINLASTKQLKHILFNKFGESVTKRTKKDNAQVDNEVLEQFSETYEWIAKLLELRKIEKLLSTYVLPILGMNENGTIYPQWLQHGTTSGRFSCTAPNFQTLPRENTSIKKGIIARPGYTLINLDYAQLEVRCFAHTSGDVIIQESFRQNQDFYGLIAKDLFNLECEVNEVKQQYPKERQYVKQIGLGLMYGLRKWKLAHILGCQPDDAQIVIDKYFETYKQLKDFIKRCHTEAYKTESIRGESGRIRNLTGLLKMRNIPEMQHSFNKLLNLSVNHCIQSLAASIINRATFAIYAAILDNSINANIILQVHDSLVIEVQKEQVDKMIKIAKNIMEVNLDEEEELNYNLIKLDVPLIVEYGTGSSLAECK